MPKYLLTFHLPKAYSAMADTEMLPAWNSYLTDVIGPSVVDPGWPVFEDSTVVGEAGAGTKLGGLLGRGRKGLRVCRRPSQGLP
jgi:hypothetical protein